MNTISVANSSETQFRLTPYKDAYHLKLLTNALQVLHGAVHVAKFAVLAGLTAVATDKIHKEYVTRKVISASVTSLFIVWKFTPALCASSITMVCWYESTFHYIPGVCVYIHALT